MSSGHKILYFIAFSFLLIISGGCSTHKHTVHNKKPKNEKIVTEIAEGKEIARHLKGEEKMVVEEAFEWLGTPYKYGRQDKGVATDCSGLTMVVFNKILGCKLPRNSAKQGEFCKEITESEVKPGDLVFFDTSNSGKIGHVGIMIDKTQFIHASSSKGVVISSMNSNYYKTHFKKYGRVPCMKH